MTEGLPLSHSLTTQVGSVRYGSTFGWLRGAYQCYFASTILFFPRVSPMTVERARLAGGGGEPGGTASDGAVRCGVAGKVMMFCTQGRAQPRIIPNLIWRSSGPEPMATMDCPSVGILCPT